MNLTLCLFNKVVASMYIFCIWYIYVFNYLVYHLSSAIIGRQAEQLDRSLFLSMIEVGQNQFFKFYQGALRIQLY